MKMIGMMGAVGGGEGRRGGGEVRRGEKVENWHRLEQRKSKG